MDFFKVDNMVVTKKYYYVSVNLQVSSSFAYWYITRLTIQIFKDAKAMVVRI